APARHGTGRAKGGGTVPHPGDGPAFSLGHGVWVLSSGNGRCRSMRQLMLMLWQDDLGALIATEWVFVATILILGIITGLVAVRQAVVVELTDFANAVLALNMSYSFSGQTNCQASTAGSAFIDVVSSIAIGSVAADMISSASASACD